MALAEPTCAQLVQRYLGEQETTVGVSLRGVHIASTPVGQSIVVRAKLTEVDGDRLRFEDVV